MAFPRDSDGTPQASRAADLKISNTDARKLFPNAGGVKTLGILEVSSGRPGHSVLSRPLGGIVGGDGDAAVAEGVEVMAKVRAKAGPRVDYSTPESRLMALAPSREVRTASWRAPVPHSNTGPGPRI